MQASYRLGFQQSQDTTATSLKTPSMGFMKKNLAVSTQLLSNTSNVGQNLIQSQAVTETAQTLKSTTNKGIDLILNKKKKIEVLTQQTFQAPKQDLEINQTPIYNLKTNSSILDSKDVDTTALQIIKKAINKEMKIYEQEEKKIKELKLKLEEEQEMRLPEEDCSDCIRLKWIKVQINGRTGKYKGNWVDGLPHDHGEFIYSLDKTKYSGNFYKGSKHGHGMEIYSCGSKYIGAFDNGKQTGKAIYIYNTGDVYKGKFRNGVRSGLGICYYSEGEKYIGNWANNLREGHGSYYYTSGDVYKGDWNHDQRHGSGIYTFNDGCKFDGMYFNDCRHGKGKMFDKDGNQRHTCNYDDGVEHLTTRQTMIRKGNIKEANKKREKQRQARRQEVKIPKVPTCNFMPNFSLRSMFQSV